MTNIHIYNGNPTSGGADGTLVSESGAQTNPITASLVVDASNGATGLVKCAIRCDTGYQVSGNTVIKTVTSSNNSYADYTGTDVQIADDSISGTDVAIIGNSTWVNSLTLSNVGATNKIFYVKFNAAAGSTPVNDASVSLYFSGTIEAV